MLTYTRKKFIEQTNTNIYTYIYISKCINFYINKYIHIHTYSTQMYVFVCMFSHIDVFTFVCRLYICTYVRLYNYICLCTYVHTYIQSRTHTSTHKYVHIRKTHTAHTSTYKDPNFNTYVHTCIIMCIHA